MKQFAICLLMGALFAGYALAQTFNASLGGTVSDSSGAVVPKATVTATGIETGVAVKTVTNTSGVYEFPSLQEGNYRVSAEMGGFKEFVYQRVTLDVGAQVRLNFALEVGAATTITTVTAAADSAIGTLTGPGTNFTIGCRTGGGPGSSNPGYDTLGVNLTTASAPGSGSITITVTSPESKTATIVTIPVTVN